MGRDSIHFGTYAGRKRKNMRINNNMSAVITNKQLLRTENNLTKSMERLSSGLKINHAKDNPAGMAISNKDSGTGMCRIG